MSIIENLNKIKHSLKTAAIDAGRDPLEITLLPVSKRKPLDAILEAYKAGERVFGENRVDEALEKMSRLPSDVEIDMIGHLQSNKAAKTAGKFRLIHSVDSLKLAGKLNKANKNINKIQDILIELNCSGEEAKHGYRDRDRMLEDLQKILNMENLRVRGFMTMAPFIVERDLIRKTFITCRQWRDKASEMFPEQDFSILSMGMSGDFVEAIEEGATMVRVGTAIFGERQY